MPRDETTIRPAGGGLFRTTHWTEIFTARSGDEPRKKAALDELLTRYWKPVYCYLRRKGYDSHTAKDLTQGFFYKVVLGGDIVGKADRARGRFRTFLLTVLERYVAKVRRAEKAKRRMPEGGFVRLDGIDGAVIPEPVQYSTPIEAFEYAWATALLDEVLAEVARKCRETDSVAHWEVFRARFLLPIVDGDEPTPLADLCAKYGISKKAKASKMVQRIKRLFRVALRRHVRQFVDSDAEVDDEIRYLMRVFFRSGGRS